MKYILLLLSFIYNAALAQQKESTVSISCYVNPELYIQASVIAQVSDKAGNVSCNGKYVSLNNKSENAFHYKMNNSWVMLKPQGRTVFLVGGANTAPSKSPSVFKLNVKYKPDASGNISTKIRTISQFNAQTDQVIARELEEGISKASNEPLAKVNTPSTVEESKAPPATTTNKDIDEAVAVKGTPKTPPKQNKPESIPEKKPVVVKAKPKAPPKQNRPESGSEKKRYLSNSKMAPANAIGLRIDFGTGSIGVGPNIKHKFNRNLSLDAAIVFFEGDSVGLGAQVEQNLPLKGTPGLKWYIGVGPQFLFNNENTAISIVPVTGLEYNIPGSPLNFSLDWRPNFYLSPGADVEAGRFGLSLRVAF